MLILSSALVLASTEYCRQAGEIKKGAVLHRHHDVAGVFGREFPTGRLMIPV